MNKKYILCLVFAFVWCACGVQVSILDAKQSTMKDFGAKVKLHGKIMDIDSVWKSSRIYCNDSLIFLVDNNLQTFVHVFNINTKRQVVSNIHLGNGPNERLICFDFQVGSKYVYALDGYSRKIDRYRYQDFVTTSNVAPDKVYDFECLPFSFAANSKNEIATYLVHPDYDDQTLLTVFDQDGVRQPVVVNTPSHGDVHDTKYMFQCRLFYNEQQQKFVVTYQYTDVIDVYDNSFKLLCRAQGPDAFLPKMFDTGKFMVEDDDTRYSYADCSLTSNEIWLLYNGATSAKDEKSDQLYNKIFVYDYAGKPLKYYYLDIPVFGFCVNEANKTIYGLSDYPERSIVEFKYD